MPATAATRFMIPGRPSVYLISVSYTSAYPHSGASLTAWSRPPSITPAIENSRSACSKLAAALMMFGETGAICGGPNISRHSRPATNVVFPSPVAAPRSAWS